MVLSVILVPCNDVINAGAQGAELLLMCEPKRPAMMVRQELPNEVRDWFASYEAVHKRAILKSCEREEESILMHTFVCTHQKGKYRGKFKAHVTGIFKCSRGNYTCW